MLMLRWLPKQNHSLSHRELKHSLDSPNKGDSSLAGTWELNKSEKTGESDERTWMSSLGPDSTLADCTTPFHANSGGSFVCASSHIHQTIVMTANYHQDCFEPSFTYLCTNEWMKAITAARKGSLNSLSWKCLCRVKRSHLWLSAIFWLGHLQC